MIIDAMIRWMQFLHLFSLNIFIGLKPLTKSLMSIRRNLGIESPMHNYQSSNAHVREKSLLTDYALWRYIYYFMFGLAYMLAWNIFISIPSYFQKQFKGSRFVDNFQNYFSIVYMFTMLICITLIVYLVKRVMKKYYLLKLF